MSNESKKYSLEEKTKIALEAVSGKEGTIEEIAEKYNVSSDDIQKWIDETGVKNPKTAEEIEDEFSVTLDSTEEFAQNAEYGVTPDKLNYGRLTFWSVFGTLVILLFIVAIMFTYEYTFQGSERQASEQSQFYDINELQERERMKLSSFGVVDLEEGVYRIPIDSAISRIARDSD